MRIALVAPPMLRIPPVRYAGTERVVAALGDELHRRGHEVTLFASADSEVAYDVVPTVDRALWLAGIRGDISRWLEATAALVAGQLTRFDVVHSHIETFGLELSTLSATPVVTTFHGRLDTGPTPGLLRSHRSTPLVAISRSQRRWFPANNWVATVPHGLPFRKAPGPVEAGRYLAVVGRATHEKGIAEAIEIARRVGLPLVMAAKAYDPEELAFVDAIIRPAVREGIVEFRGEVSTVERDEILCGAFATLMLGAWPEPFGLVAIESLALGTPVIARRAGALPEIIEHGVDGFLVDDLLEAEFAMGFVASLDRGAIARRARDRFSVERMTDRYEDVYAGLVAASGSRAADTLDDPDLGEAALGEADQKGRRVDAVPAVGRT
jgi:glycosyltransferase involved in cell wall biosynthesis